MNRLIPIIQTPTLNPYKIMWLTDRIKKYYRKWKHYCSTPAMVQQTIPAKESGWIDMYYKDSIHLDFDADSVDNADWIVTNNTLRLRHPEKLDRCFYALTLFFTGDEIVHGKYRMPVQTKHYVNVRIRSWKTDEYRLVKAGHDWQSPQFVQRMGDSTIFFKHNYLYAQRDGEKSQRICKMCIQYVGGFEIKGNGEYWAVRNGTRILVANDLRGPWTEIFNDPRSTGIRHSMEFVTNEKGETELLFSEYTVSWGRHHIYCYNVAQKQLNVLQTFYSMEEHTTQGLKPHARHTHILIKDPYTGYIFIGNGDYSDGSSAIYYSKDNCRTLIRVGAFSQCYRTLSFIFTEQSIFWNMDSPYEPQYICRLSRKDLPEADVKESPITKFPLIQSAQWLIEKLKMEDGETMYVMATNREANFYDERIHTFGIQIVNEEPVFYDLLALPFDGDIFHQYDPLGVMSNKILLMDEHTGKRAFYKLEKINH